MSSVHSGTAEGQLRHARTELESGLRAGTDRRAETLLAAYPALAADAEAAIELVYTEFVVRQEIGQNPTPAEWFARFPQWRVDLEQMFQVHDVLCQSTAKSAGRSRADVALSAERSPVLIPGYDILEELGRGGMGVVYRARHTKLNRVVAVKVILGGATAGTKERERFRREAEAAARLDHPNIVRIYEVGEHGDRPYCAMEYVAGGQLAAKMTGTPWPVESAARLVAELARAADHAHQRGVVHRDLKPANILLANSELGTRNSDRKAEDGGLETRSAIRVLSSEFLPKIADFGLAKCLSDSNPAITRAGDVVGTPMYMAPEQAAGREAIGPEADVWALGVILYELLTGHAPFRGDSAEETLNQVRKAEPVPPRQLRAKLPRDLDTVCLRCLQKEPHRRYSSAAAVADDLERWARGEAIAARPVRWPEVVAKWARREPVVAGLAASIVLVTLAGLAGVVWQWQRADRERNDAVRAGQQAADSRDEAVRVSGLEAIARESAEAQLYASRIAQAALDVAASRTAAAERLLDDCKAREPDRCRWEWDYLKRKCQTHVLEMVGHTQPVNSVVYSPDGRWVASGSGVWNGTDRGEVKVWDAATGRLVYNLTGPLLTVHRVAFHPSGDELAAGSADGHVWRWNLRDGGNPLPTFDCSRAAAYGIAYHPDGQSLAVAGGDGSVQVWDIPTSRRRVRFPWHTSNVYDVAYSPDGKLFASTCRDGEVTIRSTAEDYRSLFELRLGTDARRVIFAPDGRLLATLSFDGEVVLWDVAAGGKRMAAHHVGNGLGRDLGFRPDNHHLACASHDADLRVWRVRGQGADPVVGSGTGSAVALAYSPDARRLAVAAWEDNTIRVWDVTAPPEQRTVEWRDIWIPAIAVSPDGRTLALAGAMNQSFNRGPKIIRLMSVAGEAWSTLTGHKGWPTCVAYRPDGGQLASADDAGVAILWDPVARRQRHRLANHTGPVHALAYSPDGRRLATASEDRTVRLWDTATGTELAKLDHPSGVQAVAFSSDGTLLATGCDDRLVRVWDATTLTVRHVLTGHRGMVNSLAFRPGSAELATADDQQEVRFWAADTGRNRTVHTPPAPPANVDPDGASPATRAGTSLAYSPDGRRLAFGGTSGPTQLWDADARRPLLDLGEANFLHKQSVAFLPDGVRLVTASRTQVQFWDSTVVSPADRLAASVARARTWHFRQADATERNEEWFAAEFHAGRVLSETPLQAEWYARRGQFRAAQGQTAGADADHARALALVALRAGGTPSVVPGNSQVWNQRGEALAQLGRWDGVVEANRFAVLHDPNDVVDWGNLASAALMRDDVPGYRGLCREIVRRFAESPPDTVIHAFYALAPQPADFDPDTWLRLGRQGQAAKHGLGGPTVLAVAYYRAGRPADTLITLNADFYIPRAWDMLFRAMAHHRLGQSDEAQRWLARARVWAAEADRIAATPTAAGGTRWRDWNEKAAVRTLFREAEALIPEPAR